jgi:hypothetical protein
VIPLRTTLGVEEVWGTVSFKKAVKRFPTPLTFDPEEK